MNTRRTNKKKLNLTLWLKLSLSQSSMSAQFVRRNHAEAWRQFYITFTFVCSKSIYFGLEHGNDFLWGDYQRRYTLRTSLFHRLYGCQVTRMENDQITPLFIVKIPSICGAPNCDYFSLQQCGSDSYFYKRGMADGDTIKTT